MAENDSLTPKQVKAIAAILAEPTIEKAAITADISERQLYRWLDIPEFRAELRAAENGLIESAGARLSAGLDLALTALSDLIKGAESESVKARAAAEWINQALKVQELRALSERIDELEKRLNV